MSANARHHDQTHQRLLLPLHQPLPLEHSLEECLKAKDHVVIAVAVVVFEP